MQTVLRRAVFPKRFPNACNLCWFPWRQFSDVLGETGSGFYPPLPHSLSLFLSDNEGIRASWYVLGVGGTLLCQGCSGTATSEGREAGELGPLTGQLPLSTAVGLLPVF